jgi:translation initiation factor IF-3
LYISKSTRLNQSIQASQLRVIDQDGSQLGVFSRQEALKLAEERDLDLVEISPDAKPPVAKIIDWGKFNYQKTKQNQKTKRNNKLVELKEMRFGLKISEHDMNVKLNKVKKFLDSSNKVKITVIYRGRELAHKDIGFTLADKMIAILGDTIIIDQQPQFAGKQLNFVIRSNNNAKTKDA